MMISPEGFIEEYRNSSYKELLIVRDELLAEIRAFEKNSYNPKLDMVCPSPEVVYQCNLEYLATGGTFPSPMQSPFWQQPQK